jgi:tetratricopeptide (TPR) repeat protein
VTDYWMLRSLSLDIEAWLAPVLARHRGDPSVRARACYTLAVRAALRGERQRAADAFAECAALSEQTGNRQLALLSESRLAWVLYLLEAHADATAHREHALAALATETDPLTRAQASDWLVWRGEAEPWEVRASLESYHRVAEAAGDIARQATTAMSLGVEAMIAGDYAAARDWLERARGFMRPTWGTTLMGGLEANLGQIALYEGNTREARERLTEAACDAVRLGEPDKLQEVLIGLAAVAKADGDDDRAKRLLAAARAVYGGAMSQEARALHEHYLAGVDARLEDTVIAPGAPIGMRELDALLGDKTEQAPSVS